MEYNAYIDARLIDILNILDARAIVEIYTIENDNKLIERARVYELLTDKIFLHTYKNYEVSGLVLGLVDRILISKEA